MSNRFPPWLVVPISLLAAVGATFLVGALESKSDGPIPDRIIDSVPTPSSDDDAAADSDPKKHPVFPDFSGVTVDDQRFRLSDYRGKIVLVNFWATWCGPCKMEIPDLIALQAKYAPRGFTVVGLSEDKQFSQAVEFAKTAKMNYPVMKTPDGLAYTLGVTGLPTSVLVGKDGKIITAVDGVLAQGNMLDLWGPKIEKVL